MFKKAMILIIGAVMTAVMMLASGGTYLLPESIMGIYMHSGIWDVVGGVFGLMLVPGFTVGYAACQSRILGAIYFIAFIVLGLLSGISIWWIATAVLLILSYIFCISENVGYYDELEAYDRICVLVPAFGALRFIDRFGLEGFFGVIGKILSVLAIILNFALMVFLWIIPKDTTSFFGTVLSHLKDFGSTLFGITVIFVFLPLFSVYSARYSFIRPGLAKVLSCVFGGYNIMRGAFVSVPVMMSSVTGSSEPVSGENPLFNDIFGTEMCFLTAMLIGGILCVNAAFGKKLGLVAHFCLTTDGTSSLRCLMMAALVTVLVLSVSPCVILVAWLAAVAVVLMMGTFAISLYEGYTYEDLRHMGYSDYEARRLLRDLYGKMTAI